MALMYVTQIGPSQGGLLTSRLYIYIDVSFLRPSSTLYLDIQVYRQSNYIGLRSLYYSTKVLINPPRDKKKKIRFIQAKIKLVIYNKIKRIGALLCIIVFSNKTRLEAIWSSRQSVPFTRFRLINLISGVEQIKAGRAPRALQLIPLQEED